MTAGTPARSVSTVRDLLADAARRLNDAGVDQPGLDARLLLGRVLGIGHADFILKDRSAVALADKKRFDALVARRAARAPVSRILGSREFYGRDFEVAPSVLDPRPDTETLIDTALDMFAGSAVPKRILDLGTGSGAILLTLLAEWPGVGGTGVDVSSDALDVARRNAAHLGLDGHAEFMLSDWDNALTGTFDLIVSNPPYIPSSEIAGLASEVRDHDPHVALDGGGDGLDAYRAIAALTPRRLASGGTLLVEIGFKQAIAVSEVFQASGLVCLPPRPDLRGRDRILTCHGSEDWGKVEKALGMPGRSR